LISIWGNLFQGPPEVIFVSDVRSHAGSLQGHWGKRFDLQYSTARCYC